MLGCIFQQKCISLCDDICITALSVSCTIGQSDILYEMIGVNLVFSKIVSRGIGMSGQKGVYLRRLPLKP